VIVVDSSVWILPQRSDAPHVRRLQAILGVDEIVVGNLMLCEVLQGLDSEREAREVEALLRRCAILPMAGDMIALQRLATSVPCAAAGSLFARPSIC
jgi:hypothetical protein